MSKELDRREMLTGTALGAAVLGAGMNADAQRNRPGASAENPLPGEQLAAQRPAGFTPYNQQGRVVRINKRGSLRPGNLFPRPEAAQEMVDRAITTLTGEATPAAAWRRLVHPSDRVAIKTNGLGLRNIASNKETVVAIVNGVIAAGVPANQVVVYDQWNGFLMATRLDQRSVPAGVRLLTHANRDLGPHTRVASGRTQYAQALLDATAVIGVPLVKDHSLSGFTGAMKNLTHGSIRNPEDFHRHHCSPQIAELFNHPAIASRVRVHIMDAFKVLYDRGPQDNPSARVPYEAVFASTDAVALDRLGAEIVDQLRTQNHMQTLARRGTPPDYIDHAATLGLGIADRARIQLQEVTLT